ncbi:MAG: HEAT repeat domain-containing protein [Acidobacteria bacterium]|nr:HEAT repeat domain-containing protein [Acidobacteriota bacterium]
MEKNLLKKEGLAFGHTLQRAYKIVYLYTTEHAAAEEPLHRAYEALNSLLKQTPQFTFGFFNRRVVLNELLTPDTTLEALASEFDKRNIAAVTFFLGLTYREFRRGLVLLTTKPEAIEQSGGINAFLQKNSIEGMRIVAPEKRPKETGDTVLGIDFQSYMMAHTMLDTQQARFSPNLQLLLQSAGMEQPGEVPGTPVEMLDLVGRATQAAWINPEGDPQQAVQALARLLEEMSPGTLIAALPPDRQSHLVGRSAYEVAAELAEDNAIEWAKRRWTLAEGESGKGIAEEEVVRVLGRALQTTQVAERLLQKLAGLVDSGELPRRITDRIRQEMRWSGYSLGQRHLHLLALKWFNEQDFRHLVEYIKEAGKEGYLEKATEVAQHFLKCLDSAGPEAQAMGLTRLQDLIKLLTGLHTLDFVRTVVERFSKELVEDISSNPARHQQIASCLAAAAQSLAMFEEFETALQIGNQLERSRASDEQQHTACCGVSLQNLLTAPTIERLIEVALEKRTDLKKSRLVASLLRLVEAQAAEIVFRLLEEERSASSRSRLLHIARQFGKGAFDAATKRLEDERWYVVRNACTVLGALNDPDLCIHLESALRHTDSRVQQAAVTAIIRSTVPGRGAALVNALPALPAHLQESVLDELVLLKDATALGPLEGFLLRNPTFKTGVLEKALRALIAIPDERIVEVLNRVVLQGEAAASLRRTAFLALKSSAYPQAQQKIAQFRQLAPNDRLFNQ